MIRIETQTGDYYYISYRRRIGYDQNLDSDYYDRTSIHRAAADGTGSSMLVVALQDSGVFNGDDGLIVTQVGHDDSSVTLIIEGAGPLCADGDSDGLCDIDDPCPDDPQNDADSDGVCADDDCDSGNPDAFATPEEVARVVSEPIEGGQILHWNDQLAPVPDGLVYDVFSGNLSDVRSGGDFGQGTCAAEDLPTDMYEDMATTPPPGEGFYYLIRGQNECPDGTGTYGAVQRDSGAASSTASCN